MPKFFVRNIPDNIYHRVICLVIGDKERFDVWLKKQYDVTIPQDYANGRYFMVSKQGEFDVHVIWMGSFRWTIRDYGILVHEIFHLVMDVMESVGIRYSDDSEEAYTYYLQNIYCECLRQLRRKL